MDPAEFRNYLLRCIDPRFGVRAATHTARRMLAFLGTHGGSERGVPTEVRNERTRFLDHEKTADVPVVLSESVLRGALQLAHGFLEFDGTPDWGRRFSDGEIAVSIHRWNWLLQTRGKSWTVEDGLWLMRSWLSFDARRQHEQSDAYSAGERIVNGCLFLVLAGVEVPPDMKSAFAGMARHIAEAVEYDPFDLTGNHAFNNSRGLYFAGRAAGVEGAAELAKAIARERLPELVTVDGFLREGSSHYHFLFTRWVLEMRWLAQRIDDREFLEFLTPYASQLVKQCWFFLVVGQEGRWALPLIGDISPDCSPHWLVSLPWSAPAFDVHPVELPATPPTDGDWALLFGGLISHSAPVTGHTSSFPASGWHRVDCAEWTLIARSSDSTRTVRFHAHQDLGSFVLFFEGAPLLVDRGRSDYSSSPSSKHARTAPAHNTLLIDGLAPSVLAPLRVLEDYRRVSATSRLEEGESDVTLVLSHDGFSRMALKNVVHERRFVVSQWSVVIEDRFNGVANLDVDLFFHWAPTAGEPKAGFHTQEVALQGASLIFTYPPAAKAIAFVYPAASAYGVTDAGHGLKLSASIQAPTTLTTTIERNKAHAS